MPRNGLKVYLANMSKYWYLCFLFCNRVVWSTWVLYGFKALHFTDKCIFYVLILLWKKILSIEKLHLTWNMQTNFNKLRPLPRVFQILLRGRGWEICFGDFSIGWWQSDKEWFWPLNPFSKLKTTCKYWTLIKIKISLTCVCKEYDEGKIKMVQELSILLKMKLGYNMKMGYNMKIVT